MKLTEIKQLLRESENDIPMSEWKKVFQYVERGSDFRKVGAACQRNPEKMRCRYLILKALGMDRAAYDFKEGANMRWSVEDELDKLPLPEVPAQFQDKTSSVDNYEDQAEEFKKRTMSGPLKELAQMGIKFVQLYPSGKSSRKRDVEIANEVMGGKIPTWRPASTGLEFRNGRRWDVNQSIIMLNGHTKDGYKWFKYTDHTNEGVDSPSYGYDIGSPRSFSVGAAEHTVERCRKWIRDNIIKDDENVGESMNKNNIKENLKNVLSEASKKKIKEKKEEFLTKEFDTNIEDYLDKMFGETLISIDPESLMEFGYYNELIDKSFEGDPNEFLGFLYDHRKEPFRLKEYIDPKEGLIQEFTIGKKKIKALILDKDEAVNWYWFDGTEIYPDGEKPEETTEVNEAVKSNTKELIEQVGLAILRGVDEDNFAHNMRYKWIDVEEINEANNTAVLYWQTQEDFRRYEFNEFMAEVRRAAKAIVESGEFEIASPITFKVIAECRDGREYGYNTRKIVVGETGVKESL